MSQNLWKVVSQSSPDRGQSRKSRLVNFRGPDSRKLSELCVLLFFQGKSTKCSQNPGLVNEFSATPRGRLNWTGPIANSSEFQQCANQVHCNKWVHLLLVSRCLFCGIEVAQVSFLVSRSLFFRIEILHSVVQHLDFSSSRDQPVLAFFWASTSCKMEVKEDLDAKIEDQKKNSMPKKRQCHISIPTKRVTRNKRSTFLAIFWWFFDFLRSTFRISQRAPKPTRVCNSPPF